MAYVVPSNSVLGVTFRGFVSGQTVMTTLAYRLIGAQPPVDGQATINLVNNLINLPNGLHARYMNCMASNYTVARIDMQWISLLRYRKLTFTPTVVTGQQPTSANTPNVASVVSLVGDVADRKSISNKHLPALPQGAYIFGNLSEGYMDDLSAFANQALSAIDVGGGANLIPIVYNRVNGESSPILQNFLINPHVRVMRRRTVGLGI